MNRTERTKRWVVAATVAIVVCGVAALFHWGFTSRVINEHQTFFKLVGYVVAPSLAYLGFIWGLLDKATMSDLTTKLTKVKTKAAAAAKAAEIAKHAALEAQNDADAQRIKAEKSLAAADVAHPRAEQQDKVALEAIADADAKTARIVELEDDFKKMSDSTQLWRLGNQSRNAWGFPKFDAWKHDPEGARIVTIGLFKGGVGKTHLAANFAAYVSEKQQKPVLLIDLDYQGSLSSLLLAAAQIGKEELSGELSRVDALFDQSSDCRTIDEKRVALSVRGAALNGGNGLSNAWVVSADYSLTAVESSLLIDRTIRNTSALDERYRLAHLLLNPAVRRQYAMIIIDTPPRMTLGTVNALVASHALIIPTILDKVSGQTVKPFLAQFQELKSDLLLDSLDIAAFVATMTAFRETLAPAEETNRNLILAVAHQMMGRDDICFTQQHLPRKAGIRSNLDLGYFINDHGLYKDQFYDAIFDELWERIHAMPLQRTNRVKLFNV